MSTQHPKGFSRTNTAAMSLAWQSTRESTMEKDSRVCSSFSRKCRSTPGECSQQVAWYRQEDQTAPRSMECRSRPVRPFTHEQMCMISFRLKLNSNSKSPRVPLAGRHHPGRGRQVTLGSVHQPEKNEYKAKVGER